MPDSDAIKQEAETNLKIMELQLRDQKNAMRPSSHHNVDVVWSQTLCKYMAVRDNIATTGDTPEMACDNFDHLWVTGEGRVDIPADGGGFDFD